MKYALPYAVVLLLSVTACISKKEITDRNTMDAAANRLVTCVAGADCEEKWRRAGRWVRANAAHEITTQSDSLIETAGPSGLFDDHLGFTVIKKPGFKKPPEATVAVPAADNYDIVLFTRCNNWFGCVPSQLEAKANFTNFVIGSPPTAKPVLGVKVSPVSMEMAQKMQMTAAQGLAVTAITQHSLAEKAGLAEGDIIVHYNGVLVLTESALVDLVANTQPGQRVTLDIIRGKKPQTLSVEFPAASAK